MFGWWHDLDADAVMTVKIGVAAVGAIVLAAGTVLAWLGRERVLARTRTVALAAVGIASACCYVNLFHFHYDDPLHEWDIYHYYVGAKYLPELGYTRLYACSVVAERELDGQVAPGRTVRDLASNQLVPVATVLADPRACTDRFAPERWREFVADIAFFRGIFTPHRWTEEVLHDHGFNGTPVWALLGRALASTAPASHDQIAALALLDPLLLLAMWAAVAWAFGWRTACVGMVWWGTSYPTQYYWTGGAFLRMDWLALCVIAICLVRRGRPFAGGVAFAFSALLRVFPAFAIAAFVLHQIVACVRARRFAVPAAARRFLVGCAVATAVLVPVALIAQGAGPAEFIANSQKHLDTPLTNNMGWKTVVAYDRATRERVAVARAHVDPFDSWKGARRQTFERRRWMFAVGLGAFVALLIWASTGAPDWAALALGIGLIPFAAELTCYYYAFLIAFALLWSDRGVIGVGLCITAIASNVITRLAPWDDARYYDISMYVLIFVVVATATYRLLPLGTTASRE